LLVKVWSGSAEFITGNTLHAKGANFTRLRVSNRDKLVILPAAPADATPGTPKLTLPDVECVRLLEDDLVEVHAEGFDAALTAVPIDLQIWRTLERACPVCERAGLFEESDHKHCELTRERLSLSYPHAFSPAQRERAMKELLETGAFSMVVPLFNAKRKVAIHSTTFAENDAKREWEQEFIGTAKDYSITYYAEHEARVHAAYALDDDGSGNSPFKALTEDHKNLPSPARTKLMAAFFKDYSDSAYRILLEQIRRMDSLIEEVCAENLADHYTEAELLNLCEDLATNCKVLSEVRYFNGQGKVFFTNAGMEQVDRAREWADNLTREVRKENNGMILRPRAQDIETLALLATEFRGDQRQRFTDDSAFEDRVAYLMELPMPLFYLYVRAGNIWRLRTFKAAEPAMVGNF
jgi:hypothetical protein